MRILFNMIIKKPRRIKKNFKLTVIDFWAVQYTVSFTKIVIYKQCDNG